MRHNHFRSNLKKKHFIKYEQSTIINRFLHSILLVETQKTIVAMESKTEVDGTSPPATETLKSIDTQLDATPAKPVEPITATPAIDTQNNGNDEPKTTATIDTVNKTTTTVTVNISQTKVVIDGSDKESNIDKVVSTFGTIAAETVSAVDNAQQEAATNSVQDVQDVEMVESNDDVEMVDAPVASVAVPQIVEPTAASTESNETKPAEAVSGTTDVTMANNEADQRIDDVEKNISNLFNGEENVVSTNTKADETKSAPTAESSAKVDESNANGSAIPTANSLSHETTNDNHDLVSILTGTDKPDDGSAVIGSSEVKTDKAADNKVTDAVKAPATSDEIKLEKAEEESVDDIDAGIASKTAKKEIISSHSSTVDVKPTVSGKTRSIQTNSAEQFLFISVQFSL